MIQRRSKISQLIEAFREKLTDISLQRSKGCLCWNRFAAGEAQRDSREELAANISEESFCLTIPLQKTTAGTSRRSSRKTLEVTYYQSSQVVARCCSHIQIFLTSCESSFLICVARFGAASVFTPGAGHRSQFLTTRLFGNSGSDFRRHCDLRLPSSLTHDTRDPLIGDYSGCCLNHGRQKYVLDSFGQV